MDEPTSTKDDAPTPSEEAPEDDTGELDELPGMTPAETDATKAAAKAKNAPDVKYGEVYVGDDGYYRIGGLPEASYFTERAVADRVSAALRPAPATDE